MLAKDPERVARAERSAGASVGGLLCMFASVFVGMRLMTQASLEDAAMHGLMVSFASAVCYHIWRGSWY